MDKDLKKDFVSLVRLGIEHRAFISERAIDWNGIESLATRHGLLAVVLDGADHLVRDGRLPASYAMDTTLKKQWIGRVISGYESRYSRYKKAIGELASFYNDHGFKMMILKGYACSLDWPKPNHRPTGDIDVWLFGKQKDADAIMANEKNVIIDDSHHHHTVFYWGDFMVENHYDFINVHHHKSNPELEGIFKELGKDDTFSIVVNDEKVYLPSPNLHALFVIRHTMEHFAAAEVTLRNLLDWAFFVQSHSLDINWPWLESVLEQFGMKRLYDTFNAICVEDLGFDSNSFPHIQFEPWLKERVLNDILTPEFSEEEPTGVISRIGFKFRRWKANRWKQELCYPEGMWSTFWSGVWTHILKPSSI